MAQLGKMMMLIHSRNPIAGISSKGEASPGQMGLPPPGKAPILPKPADKNSKPIPKNNQKGMKI